MGSKKAGKLTWDELLDEYFFSRNLRPDTEWSYRKVSGDLLILWERRYFRRM